VEPVPQAVDQPLGDTVGRWLDRLSWLRNASDADLLTSRLRVGDGVRLRTTASADAGGWQTESSRLAMSSGFRWSLECDEAVAALVAGCDGTRRLAELVSVLAVATGVAPDDLAPAVCTTVRGLVDRGILEPPSSPA
jgi:hypothetical protein